MRRFQSALVVLTALAMPAAAGPIDQYVGFGDSTLDSGYFRYHSMIPAYDPYIAAAVAAGNSGGFVGNGVVNATILAAKFDLTALPVGAPGGTNYAIGNAQSAVTSGNFLSTVQQIQNYLANVSGKANPDALYVIHTGDNDRTLVMTSGAAWNAANPNYLSNQASAVAAQVTLLQAAGARTILVSNSYDSAVYAGLGGDIAPANTANYALAVAHGTNIWSDLTASGVRFVPVDRDSVFAFVVHNPTKFGFTANSVLPANAPCMASALICTTITQVQQKTFLFVDAVHMTTAGQTIVADYEYSLIAGPNQMSLLGESNVQAGLSRIAAVQGQANRSGPEGWRAWIGGGADDLSIKNSTGMAYLKSTPWRGTLGADYRTASGVTLGAAFTAGGQTAHFSTGGGFVQTDETVDLYAGYTSKALWANALVSYGALSDDTTRVVPLGIYTDENRGNTDGQSLAVAVRGGADFDFGSLTTGPVAGVVLQRVHFGAFAETGASAVTALAFAGQRRDSAITQLGWRAAFTWGKLQPFASVEWQHEWAGKNRRVTAAITTAATAPYSIDAAPIASDWATASAGAAYQIAPELTLVGTLSSTAGNPNVNNYGGDLRLALGF